MTETSSDAVVEDLRLRLRSRPGELVIRGNQVILPGASEDGASGGAESSPVRLAPGPLALMRVLAKAQGAVLSREHLLAVLPSCGSEHALEMWVSRLRQSLPDPGMVQTVVKRGYRLAV